MRFEGGIWRDVSIVLRNFVFVPRFPTEILPYPLVSPALQFHILINIANFMCLMYLAEYEPSQRVLFVPIPSSSVCIRILNLSSPKYFALAETRPKIGEIEVGEFETIP